MRKRSRWNSFPWEMQRRPTQNRIIIEKKNGREKSQEEEKKRELARALPFLTPIFVCVFFFLPSVFLWLPSLARFKKLTWSEWTVGTGVTGVRTGPIPS